MNKLILALLIVAFATVPVLASPFLVCDDPAPEEQVTSYEVFQDGVSLGVTPAPLHFDLVGLGPGEYTFTATATNIWGESLPSNPYISPSAVGVPDGLGLTP
jgi:hypothetical protein